MSRKKKDPKSTYEIAELDFKGWDNKSNVSIRTTHYFWDNDNKLQSQISNSLTSLQIPKDKKILLELMKIMITMLEELK